MYIIFIYDMIPHSGCIFIPCIPKIEWPRRIYTIFARFMKIYNT